MKDIRVTSPEDRARLANYYEQAVVSLRAQGLEPDQFATAMRDRVLAGEISLEESIKLTKAHIHEEIRQRKPLIAS